MKTYLSKKIGVYTVQIVRDRDCAPITAQPTLDEPAKLAPVFRAFIGEGATKEHVVVAMLNARQRVLGINLVSVGTLTASLVHPREIFQPAVVIGAASIAIAHNHPSGDATPSPEDNDITRRIERAGELLGIPLLDHIIVTDDACFSYRERGLLNK